MSQGIYILLMAPVIVIIAINIYISILYFKTLKVQMNYASSTK